MRTLGRYVFLIFCITLAGKAVYAASFSQSAQKSLDNRPVVEYSGRVWRDPFQPTTIRSAEEMKEPIEDMQQTSEDFSDFQVQGIIWGGRIPQAIINNKVVTLGDVIGNAEVIGIDKTGVILSSGGNVVTLSVGQGSPSSNEGY